MWLISARDLQFRARRFLIAVAVTALVLGIALVFDGVKRAVKQETVDIVELFGADQWVVAEGAPGPFTTSQVLPASAADDVEQVPGVRQADPVVISRGVVELEEQLDVNVIGHRPGGMGSPPIAEGREVRGGGEIVVGSGIEAAVGDRLEIGGVRHEVVGTTEGARYYFGYPTVFMALEDAQEFAFGGQELANGVTVRGDIDDVPDGIGVLSNEDVTKDLERPLKGGIQTIDFTDLMLWIVAAGIIGSIIYLSSLERVRDFAVYKSTGADNGVMAGGLIAQAILLTLIAALVAIGIAKVVSLGLPFPAAINAGAIIQLFVIALVVGVLASLAGLRRALGTEPALAFGGA